jgi:hypothetical protein
MKDLSPEMIRKGSSEIYIDFLTKTIGASREEVLEVVKRSGISTRRIAEYLLKQQEYSPAFSDEE